MSDVNDVKTLLKKLMELDSQATSLKKQRDVLNAEAKKWADKRDSLNSRNGEMWGEVKLHKAKRDEANEAIKRLKESRLAITAQINAKREECAALREKVNKLLGETSQSANVVKRQINKLDWEIQTNPLSTTEENEIIDQIRPLEKQLLVHKEAKTLRDRLIEFRAELGALRIQGNDIHSQITELANTSQEHHKKMLEKLDEVKPLKEEADNAHKKYLESKEAADETHRRYLETLDQIKMVNAKIKEIEDAEHNKQFDKRVEMAREAAYKKLKDKKKLTLDEFKLLKEKGLI